jgi:hypothetical protein
MAIAITIMTNASTATASTHIPYTNKINAVFIAATSPSPLMLLLHQRVTNVHKLTSSLQKMKQRKESEKKDNRSRSSIGDMFMKGRTMMKSSSRRSGNGVILNTSSSLYGCIGARNST